MSSVKYAPAIYKNSRAFRAKEPMDELCPVKVDGEKNEVVKCVPNGSDGYTMYDVDCGGIVAVYEGDLTDILLAEEHLLSE